MSLNFYLNEAKKALDTERDSVLARRLGISSQKLYRARLQGWCSDEALEQLAAITGTKMDVLVLAREASKGGKYQDIFARAAELARLTGSNASEALSRAYAAKVPAVLLALALGLLAAPSPDTNATASDAAPARFQISLLPEIKNNARIKRS